MNNVRYISTIFCSKSLFFDPFNSTTKYSPQHQGRAGVQCVRPLLQAARGQQAPRHEEGRDTDPETETKGSAEGQGRHQNRR